MALLEISTELDADVLRIAVSIDDEHVPLYEGRAQFAVEEGRDHRAEIFVVGRTGASAGYEIKRRGERLVAGRVKIPLGQDHVASLHHFRVDDNPG